LVFASSSRVKRRFELDLLNVREALGIGCSIRISLTYALGLAAIVMTGITALIYSLHRPTKLGRKLCDLYKEYRVAEA
jgi:hypothetical protein